MNERKQHVIDMAHQLFIDKGFQATSIQDILDYSGISKGTFYNYFPSKNELLIAIFKNIFKKIDQDRNELLIGQNPADIEIFIKQIELQLMTNSKNKLFTLFEEVMVSNDAELKQFIKRGHLLSLRWLYQRFIEIFGESKKPYLLDCAIMFMGILQLNIKFYYMAHESWANINHVVRYSLDRIVKIVSDVAVSGEQLLQPEFLEKWLPECKNGDQTFQQNLYHAVLELKKALNHSGDQSKYIELLDFVHEELLHSKNPRKFLIESAIFSLKAVKGSFLKNELRKLEQLVETFFLQIEQTEKTP
jgi:AcrR family transcriptional regulator